MEEQKKAKEVKMNVEGKQVEDKNETTGKLTYEQLNDACNQLWQQNQQLIRRNRELEQFSMFKRLDYLFKVLDHSTMFPSDFVISCTDEIKEGMTIPQTQKEEEK